MLAHLDMPTLLRRWSEEALLHAADLGLVVTPAMHDGWIGGPPATDADIAAAEHRLGAALPPSYRAFLAVTNGWPVTWLGFGALRATTDIGWLRDLEPVTPASSSDTSDGPTWMQRALLLSTGADHVLLDPTHPRGDGEWAARTVASWANGRPSKPFPSFRDVLETLYTGFLRHTAPDSVTHTEIAEQVHTAWVALLQGDRALEPTIAGACSFGDERAALLQVQLDALTSRWPKGEDGIGISNLGHQRIALDPAAAHELWPLFVASCLDPTAPARGHDTLHGLTHGRDPRVIELVGALADTHTRTGGITIDSPTPPPSTPPCSRPAP